MAKVSQWKFRADADLKADVERIFKAQGTNFQEGMVRLVQTLVQSDEGMWPILLGQVRVSEEDLLKGLLRQVGKRPRKMSGEGATVTDKVEVHRR